MPDPTLRVAAVQAAPVFLDRAASTEKACDLIREAGRNGAAFIVFPEGFIPAHPSWYHHHTATGPLCASLALRLFEQSVEVPGPETAALGQAAREAGATVVMGLCERRPGTRGTMFNAQVFLGPDGTLLGHHRKFMPTLGERIVHAYGHGDSFGSHPAPFGRASGLICGENLNPLAIAALTAEHVVMHAMSWPAYFGLGGTPIGLLVQANAQAFALMSGAFVVSACGAVDDAMIAAMRIGAEDRAVLEAPGRTGGSLIVAPSGAILAGPMGAEEGILYADCDLGLIQRCKLAIDFGGHYQRPDIFSLQVRRTAPAARTDIHEAVAPEPAAPHDPEP